jgi:hypothetical protein
VTVKGGLPLVSTLDRHAATGKLPGRNRGMRQNDDKLIRGKVKSSHAKSEFDLKFAFPP